MIALVVIIMIILILAESHKYNVGDTTNHHLEALCDRSDTYTVADSSKKVVFKNCSTQFTIIYFKLLI